MCCAAMVICMMSYDFYDFPLIFFPIALSRKIKRDIGRTKRAIGRTKRDLVSTKSALVFPKSALVFRQCAQKRSIPRVRDTPYI